MKSKALHISSLGIARFNEAVCDAIDETVKELVGSEVLKSLYAHLRDQYTLDRSELPYRTDTICSVLESIFGVKGARTIEKRVARRLYEKQQIPFNDQAASTLQDYLTLAKKALRSPDISE